MVKMNIAFLVAAFILLCAYKPAPEKKPLIINIKNLKHKNSPINIAVVEKGGDFPSGDKALKHLTVNPKGKDEIEVEITDINYGRYAICIYQDMNNNGKLDKGFLGIPSEPIAFSNNYHPTFHPPKWDDCAFDYNATSNHIEIKGMIQLL